MLSPYRRHSRTCPHRDKGAGYQRCSCPVWAIGTLDGRRLRRSLDTRDWNRAVERVRIMEAASDRKDSADIRLMDAVAEFLADGVARNLRSTTLISYRRTFARLIEYAPRGILVGELTEAVLRKFRAGRTVAASTARKELEHLRAFSAWCVERGWMEGNPAKKLRAPRSESPGAVPYSRDEVSRLFAAVDQIGRGPVVDVQRGRQRIRAYMLLLLYSGLRRVDAAALRRTAIDADGRLTISTEKTGQVVTLKLPGEVLSALRALPRKNATFFGWTEKNSPWLVNHLWRILQSVGKAAGVHCHPHRFRDTFAVELLRTGADVRTVSKLLGHTSIRTTERHYAHFVKEEQERLDRATARLDFLL